MLVRLALENEEDTYARLAEMCANESTPHIPFSETRIRETFQQYLATATPTIFFADHQFEVVGFLMATISQYRFADGIFTTQEVLFVSPEHRRTRAAALLLDELVRWSDRLGALEITGGNDNRLFTENTARLLERFGFERAGIFMRRIGSADLGQKGR